MYAYTHKYGFTDVCVAICLFVFCSGATRTHEIIVGRYYTCVAPIRSRRHLPSRVAHAPQTNMHGNNVAFYSIS